MDKKIQVFIAGDSTAADYDSPSAPMAGWGQVLEQFFDDNISVKNKALCGRSSKSFMAEGALDIIWQQIEEGDYLFIQFGHNDEKMEDPTRYTEPHSSYKSYLKQYIEGARAKGAVPILLTPVERRRFTEDGITIDSHGEYPEAMRELAQKERVPLIDLTAKSKKKYQELGPERTKDVFLWLEVGEHKNYPQGVQDNTHFHEAGAVEIARLVLEGISELKLVPLIHHIIK